MKYLKRGLKTIGVLAALASAASASAAVDGTVNITGLLQASTCTMRMGGTSATTLSVSLPTTNNSVLSSSGLTAGSTAFTIGLACTTSTSAFWYFSAASVTSSMITNTGGATNVGIELTDSSGTAIALTTNPTKYSVGITGVSGGTDQTFRLQYKSTGAATTGTVVGALLINIYYS